MGSFHPYRVPGTDPEPKQQTTTVKEKPVILKLINSIYWSLADVLILFEKGNYRIVVLHKQMVLLNRCYSTIRGCKIAFTKIFKDNAWRKYIKPEWSHWYTPDHKWLEKKLSILDS